VQQRSRFPTPQELGEGLRQLFAAIEAVAAGARIAAIGVSIGGPIDRVAGTVSPLHQPQWRQLPLRALLEERFGCPCAIEVDTDAAALGEWHFGQQRRSPLLYVTLSTGVGAGMVIEGELYRGVAGAHPELGHQVVPNEFEDGNPVLCACGAENCLEALISGRALERRFGCSRRSCHGRFGNGWGESWRTDCVMRRRCLLRRRLCSVAGSRCMRGSTFFRLSARSCRSSFAWCRCRRCGSVRWGMRPHCGARLPLRCVRLRRGVPAHSIGRRGLR
jgi:predicted NBD/HSP70 family sugar kinase